jgi:small-conductance mechanosensitive channel
MDMGNAINFLRKFAVPGIVMMASIVATLFFRKFILNILQKWAKKTKTDVDDSIIKATRFPSIFWCIALGIYLGIKTSKLSAHIIFYASKVLSSLIIISIALALANMLTHIFTQYARRRKIEISSTSIVQTLIKIAILALGIVMLFSNLGISITPIITAMGVGALAIALALQDSLSNLFSGVHLMIEQPLKVGDYIKLDSGEEGYVIDIGWRTTKIRMLPNNMVIIPNSKLAGSIITNFNLPEKQMSVIVKVSVSYDSDPEQVESVLLDVAEKTADKVPGLLRDPAPFVRFNDFGDSALDFSLICRVEEFVNQYLAAHELRKKIFKRFQEEGIDIPFPIRTVYLKGENKSAPQVI